MGPVQVDLHPFQQEALQAPRVAGLPEPPGDDLFRKAQKAQGGRRQAGVFLLEAALKPGRHREGKEGVFGVQGIKGCPPGLGHLPGHLEAHPPGPGDHRHPGAKGPGLVLGHRLEASPQGLQVVLPHVGEHGEGHVGQGVGGVLLPSHPRLHRGQGHPCLPEVVEGQGGGQVKEAGGLGPGLLPGPGGEGHHLLLGDEAQVGADALAKVLEVGAGVGAKGDACRPEGRFQVGHHAPLAVGAQDVHRPEGPFGVAQALQQGAHPPRAPLPLAAPGVEPFQGLPVGHGSAYCRR
ncbi:hypothetical protein A0O31_00709 [Thermus brockianus]|uniref:Uncharacterized protein n=1 Tax=Thermus brockianus TaxID=56956 RepID=A0A1J0LS47_THEBO|nr:hypothetical protein A0O31_00709 [Thermus brockianus]